MNFYNIDGKIMFVDLPGYGFAKRSFDDKKRWSKLTDAYFTGNSGIDLLRCVIQLIDSKVGATDDDKQMIRYLQEAEIPFLVVYTKCDKLTATQTNELKASFGNIEGADSEILFSAKTGMGRDELWNAALRLCDIL